MIQRACATCGRPSEQSYCEQHRDASTRLRRRRMGLSGGAWDTVRRRVLKRDQGVCYLCDQLGAEEVDHLIPVAEGGTSRMDNLASAHSACHRRRHRDRRWAQPRIELALRVLKQALTETA